MDPLPHKFPAAIKSQKKKQRKERVMVGPEPRPKATVHSFFPVQTFEAQIQMLPLIRITEQQKQTKCTYWPGQNTRSDCRRAALFFLIEALIKVSL